MTLRPLSFLLILAPLGAALADTAYVSDKLVVGLYSTASTEGDRLAQLATGDKVEVLSRDLEYTQVRLEDGREGWIKNSYLSNDAPAATRVAALQAELQKLKAAADKSSQSAAQSTADARKLAEMQKSLDAARAELAARPPSTGVPAPQTTSASDELLAIDPIGADLAYRRKAWIWGTVIALLTFGIGFAVGWYLLDRKVRAKYGGLRVY